MELEIPYINEVRALLLIGRAKGQGSIEYILMLSAVSIIIVVALAMIIQLKGTALHAFSSGSNQSISTELGKELTNLTNST
jgi:hypothetical protein